MLIYPGVPQSWKSCLVAFGKLPPTLQHIQRSRSGLNAFLYSLTKWRSSMLKAYLPHTILHFHHNPKNQQYLPIAPLPLFVSYKRPFTLFYLAPPIFNVRMMLIKGRKMHYSCFSRTLITHATTFAKQVKV